MTPYFFFFTFSTTQHRVIVDYDTGRKKRADKRRDKEITEDRKRREERRALVIGAFERVIEGKIEVSPEVADEIVNAIEAKTVRPQGQEYIPNKDFDAILASVSTIEALWREYLEHDDEEVLVLL